MKEQILLVKDHMSAVPHTIGGSQNLFEAEELMKRQQIRHLPVLEDGTLIGLLSERDINYYIALTGAEARNAKVRDVCKERVLSVHPLTPVEDVIQKMAEEKYGSAVVVESGKVVGILTNTDILEIAARLIEFYRRVAA